MRYELVVDNSAEADFLAAHPATRTLFDPLLPVLQARALMAAVRLGIIKAIGTEVCASDDLASTLALDSDTLELLLRVLACAGYLAAEEDGFRLTPLALASLASGSQANLSGWLEHNYVHWRTIARLEEVLRSGRSTDAHESLANEAEWGAYQQALLETARPAAPWVAAQVPVPEGASRLLDIGGSHGLYGAAICRAHPPLHAEVLELPAALATARRLARREGIDDVVTHRAGHALTTDLGRGSVEVIFLGNLIHHFSVTANRKLLRRIAAALRPGGTVAIWDFKQPAVGSPPELVADGLALLFRLGSATRCYSTRELETWLTAAGFKEIKMHPTPAPAQLLVTGSVPG